MYFLGVPVLWLPWLVAYWVLALWLFPDVPRWVLWGPPAVVYVIWLCIPQMVPWTAWGRRRMLRYLREERKRGGCAGISLRQMELLEILEGRVREDDLTR